MSEPSAEALVRRAYQDAWNNGDLEAMLELADEDIVLRPSGKIVDLETEYRGHEGVVDTGELVLVLFRFRAKARDGMEVDAKFGQVGTLRDGRVTTLIAYPDWPSAAEAAGVEI